MDNIQSISYFYPELILTLLVIVCVIYDLAIDKKDSARVGYVLVTGLCVVGFFIFFQNSFRSTTLFSNAIVLDPFASFFKMIVLLSTIMVSIMSLYSEELVDYRKGEYFVLLGIITFGLFLLVSSIDLIMVYISIEIVSIMSFVLAGYLKQNTKSNEAALKYVVYGAFSSGIMLYGMSFLYGLTGSTNFFMIQQILTSENFESSTAILLAIIMIIAGFGYKVSAVPFHFWTPDVYEGSPTTITAYLSVAPKAGVFAMMIRFFNQALADGSAMKGIESFSSTNIPWADILTLLAIITMTVGNVVAIQQKSVKRMLAYSSIAHAGYMLLAMPVMSKSSVYAIMIYLVMYLFMNLGAFFVVIMIKNDVGGERFEHFKGLGWKMPFIGASMTLFMVSLTGLPPTAGFIGKFYIFASIIEGGPSFYWLAVIGGVNSVVSLYYYLRVVKVMYFDGEKTKDIKYSLDAISTVIILSAIPTLFLGIYWQPVAKWVESSLVLFAQVI